MIAPEIKYALDESVLMPETWIMAALALYVGLRFGKKISVVAILAFFPGLVAFQMIAVTFFGAENTTVPHDGQLEPALMQDVLYFSAKGLFFAGFIAAGLAFRSFVSSGARARSVVNGANSEVAS